jgi:AcrR family transcriptional regulator
MKNKKEVGTKRKPKQSRSLRTINLILDTVLKILRDEGIEHVNTNHIAKMAGISIGGVYQYFPDKHSIYRALHDRHVDEVHQITESIYVQYKSAPFEDFLCGLLNALIDVHAPESELYRLLLTQIPNEPGSIEAYNSFLRKILQKALSSRKLNKSIYKRTNSFLFIMATLLESLSHSVSIGRPHGLSLTKAKEEAAFLVIEYWKLQSHKT